MQNKIVDKSKYEVYEYINGYFGICEIGKFGGNCVHGGDSANEDDYSKSYMMSIYDEWDGSVNYTGDKYGYQINP